MEQSVLARDRHAYSLFRGLLELAPAEREARIGELARDDPKLAATMRAMIADAENEGDDEDDATGRLIGGRFRVLRRLGTGGMGEVYLAERADDVQQQVAVKLVRGALPAARARRERQILGRLNHPHIASLIDAGVMANGRPWFAMDYVEGESVVVACDRLALGLQARARLLAQVARAVQFAHKNLILHRDLKPSNILVDTEGAPRLLDFGIAKFLDATDAQETQTFAMTPAYASPEQLRGETATTASDIHQLGLVLYELACGIPAHKAREAAGRGAAALPRPDHALAALVLRDRAEAERIARHRGLSFDKLRKASQGDLARVIAKATADEPHERYDTAQALADDLERWAAGLPVAAHRGSFAYRLRKLVRRHAIAVAAIVLLGLGLIAATLVAVDRARTEHRQREQTEQQRQRAEMLLGFMRDVFHEGEPDNTGGAKLDAGELLQRASAKLDQRKDLDEPTKAVLLIEVADVFGALGLRADALSAAERAERALAPVRDAYPVDYLRGVEVFASALSEAGRYRDTVDLIDRALPLTARADAGGSHWWPRLMTFRGGALGSLGQHAAGERDLRLALAAYDERGLGKNSGSVLTLEELARQRYERGDTDEALRLLQRQAEVMAANEQSSSANALALQQHIAQMRLLAKGEAEAAIALMQPLIARFDALLGPRHDRSISARVLLAYAYLSAGDVSRADETLPVAYVGEAGGDTPSTNPIIAAQGQRVRAKIFLQRDDPQEALRLLRAVQPQADDPWANWLLGEALLQNRQFAAARESLQRAMQMAHEQYGGKVSTPLLGSIEDSLGRCFLMQGHFAAARAGLERAVGHFRATHGAGKPATLRSEIHGLWAEILTSSDVDALSRLRAARDQLVRAIGGSDRLQIRQADLLIGELARKLDRPGLDAAARAKVEAALMDLSSPRATPAPIGLTSFY